VAVALALGAGKDTLASTPVPTRLLMPRTARRDAPGAVQHVMVRGIERREIFVDDADRADFVARLEAILPESDLVAYAWSLMPNHVHLVVRTGQQPLARAMLRLGTGYAGRFNRRYGRAGHLFQNRYHSVPVEDDAHLRLVIRYVHLNPVHAGIVSDVGRLQRFPWTGHGVLMGLRQASFQSVGEVLSLFGPGHVQARAHLRRWMEAPQNPLPQPSSPRTPATLDRLVAGVCSELLVRREDLAAGRREFPVARARALVAHVACDRLGFTQREVAAEVGVSTTAVGHARRRGQRLLDAFSKPEARGLVGKQAGRP
jgi:REP element-mobilizing transposase RayT